MHWVGDIEMTSRPIRSLRTLELTIIVLLVIGVATTPFQPIISKIAFLTGVVLVIVEGIMRTWVVRRRGS